MRTHPRLRLAFASAQINQGLCCPFVYTLILSYPQSALRTLIRLLGFACRYESLLGANSRKCCVSAHFFATGKIFFWKERLYMRLSIQLEETWYIWFYKVLTISVFHGGHFCGFQFAFLYTKSLLKQALLKEESIGSHGDKFLFFFE